MTDYGWVIALARELTLLDEEQLLWVLRRMTLPQLRALLEAWPAWAHDGQMAPPGEWRVWLMMAGRGFGKTRAGAEWVSATLAEKARLHPAFEPRRPGRAEPEGLARFRPR